MVLGLDGNASSLRYESIMCRIDRPASSCAADGAAGCNLHLQAYGRVAHQIVVEADGAGGEEQHQGGAAELEESLLLAAAHRAGNKGLNDAGNGKGADFDAGEKAEIGAFHLGDGASVEVKDLRFAGQGDRVDRMAPSLDQMSDRGATVVGEVKTMVVSWVQHIA